MPQHKPSPWRCNRQGRPCTHPVASSVVVSGEGVEGPELHPPLAQLSWSRAEVTADVRPSLMVVGDVIGSRCVGESRYHGLQRVDTTNNKNVFLVV